MTEKTIQLVNVNPVELYGVNDTTLDQIRKYFPSLKLIARGLELKLQGEEEQILSFESKLGQLVDHHKRYGNLSEQFIKRIMNPENDLPEIKKSEDGTSDVIVHGNNGLIVKARTPNQKRIVTSYYEIIWYLPLVLQELGKPIQL